MLQYYMIRYIMLYDKIQYDITILCMLQYDTIYGMIYTTILCDTIRYNMMQYDIIRYDMIQYNDDTII